MLALLMAAFWIGAPVSVRSQPLDLSDPRFREAVKLWLADDDAASLPALAALARRGHRGAGLMLSRIEVTDRGPSPFVWSLMRSDRLKLFRAPGSGPFRPSWIAELADKGDPVAAALHAGLAQGINLKAIRELYRLGEGQAAEHLVRKVAVDGSPADRDAVLDIIGEGSELVSYVRGFMATEPGQGLGRQTLSQMLGRPVSGGDAETALAMEYVEYGFQGGTRVKTFSRKNRHFKGIARWAWSAPEMTVVRRICGVYCSSPGAHDGCTVTSLGLIGGYHEVIRFDSPLEAVIPQDRFLASPRAANMVRRRIAGARTEEGHPVMPPAELAKRSACLERAVRGMAAEPKRKQ